jgi:apolipoprotein N-acyltransferase
MLPRIAAVVASAACYGLAAPPREWWVLAWLTPALLFGAVRGLGPRTAALLGGTFGFLLGPALTPWLVHASLHYFGLSWILAGCFAAGIWVVFGALPYGLVLGARAALSSRVSGWAAPLVGAWLWTLAEYLRSTIATGLPWELLGHTQFRQLAVVQIADVGGVYAVSFLVALVSLTGLEVALPAGGRPRARGALGAVGICASVLVATLAYGQRALARASAPGEQDGRTVAAIQANFRSDFAWRRVRSQQRLAAYARLSSRTRGERLDLLVWPENAAELYLDREPMMRAGLAPAAALATEGLVVGAPRLADDGFARNSAYLVGAAGAIIGVYDKRKLVPIAEYDPFRRGGPVGDGPVYRPGTDAGLLDTGRTLLGVVVCYEVLFPALVRDLVREGAEVLVAVSNDSWLDRGDAQAPRQHFSMGVFRAIETRRYLVRAATTGISGFVSPVGEIFGAVPPDREEIAIGRVAVHRGVTPYVRWGDAWLLVASLGFAIALARPHGAARS